jgi:hypothetical protein
MDVGLRVLELACATQDTNQAHGCTLWGFLTEHVMGHNTIGLS